MCYLFYKFHNPSSVGGQDVDDCSAAGNGHFGEGGDGHPGGGIVDVYRIAAVFAQALEELFEFRASPCRRGCPGRLRGIFSRSDDRRFRRRYQRSRCTFSSQNRDRGLLLRSMKTESVASSYMPLVPGDSEVTAVVSRQGGVEGQLDGFSVGTADHCGDDITLGKMRLFQSFVIALILHDELMESCGLGGEGGKSQHPVSVVDIQDPGDRSQIVSRIVFAVSGQIISKAVMLFSFPNAISSLRSC